MRMNQTEVIGKGLKQADRDVLKNRHAYTSIKKKETFSRRELEDLMGKNRDTYKRIRGSIKRR